MIVMRCGKVCTYKELNEKIPTMLNMLCSRAQGQAYATSLHDKPTRQA